jgi:putative zinc finger/helix-turn-helix YgiT family protein
MKLSCPVCDNSNELELIKGTKEVLIRNKPITIDMEYYKCSACGEEFIVPDSENDPLENAYRLYRAEHDMLQPEEIRSFRFKYGLTQGELAKLLGLGVASISRYETGKLQDEAHDKLIRLAMDPVKLRELINNSVDVFSEDKKRKVLDVIKEKEEPLVTSLERFITLNFQNYYPDEYSGFKKFDIDRFLNAVLYFCRSGVPKTKLNKLLFYADFKHFKEYTVSISGARYAHVPFGPAPSDYDFYYPILIRQNAIEVEEIIYPKYTGENFMAKQEPNLNVFLDTELHILSLVKEFFKEFTATKMSKYSHEEKGYKDTETGELISYAYAESLKL